MTDLRINNNNQQVQVANGMKVQINDSGTFHIFSKEIKGVLYLEAFSTNLVSIKWLTNELNCNAIFSSKNVQFQDRKTGKTIGDGFLENGLYILKNQELIFSATKESIDQELWHKRLGHPSDQTLNFFIYFSF